MDKSNATSTAPLAAPESKARAMHSSKYGCANCSLTFDGQELLNTHVKVVHSLVSSIGKSAAALGKLEKKHSATSESRHTKKQKTACEATNSHLSSVAIGDVAPSTSVILRHEPLYFNDPVDLVYSLYLKSVSDYISAHVVPQANGLVDIFNCHLESITWKINMNKQVFVSSGTWKLVDLSFLDGATRANIITALENRMNVGPGNNL